MVEARNPQPERAPEPRRWPLVSSVLGRRAEQSGGTRPLIDIIGNLARTIRRVGAGTTAEISTTSLADQPAELIPGVTQIDSSSTVRRPQMITAPWGFPTQFDSEK